MTRSPKAIQQRPLPISIEEEEEEEEDEEDASNAEPDKQEEYLSEDDDVDELKAEGPSSKPFFSTMDGFSFHVDTFMELNLSRPLL